MKAAKKGHKIKRATKKQAQIVIDLEMESFDGEDVEEDSGARAEVLTSTVAIPNVASARVSVIPAEIGKAILEPALAVMQAAFRAALAAPNDPAVVAKADGARAVATVVSDAVRAITPPIAPAPFTPPASPDCVFHDQPTRTQLAEADDDDDDDDDNVLSSASDESETVEAAEFEAREHFVFSGLLKDEPGTKYSRDVMYFGTVCNLDTCGQEVTMAMAGQADEGATHALRFAVLQVRDGEDIHNGGEVADFILHCHDRRKFEERLKEVNGGSVKVTWKPVGVAY